MSTLVADPTQVTERGRRSTTIFRPILFALLVALGYYLGAKIGFALTFQPYPVSTLWPPNSILAAALILAPKRWWWFLLLAALPAHLIVQTDSGVPLPMILCWFVSNCVEGLIGATLIRKFTDGPVRFDTSRRVVIFVIAAVLAPFFSSFLDAGFVIINKWRSESYWQIWQLRFLSNLLAELTIIPFLVMWLSDGSSAFRKLSKYRYLEAAVLVIGMLFVCLLIFGGHTQTPALLYFPLPLLVWAALRFGPKGISTALLTVTVFAIWGAVHGLGPFVGRSAAEEAFSVQLFLILVSLPLMTLSAVIQEQKQLRETARENKEQLEVALDAARMGTWDWYVSDNQTKWSDETKRIFGFLPTDSEVPVEVFYGMLHEDDRVMVREAIEGSIRELGPYAAEFRISQPDGSFRWVRGQGKVLLDETGKPQRMVGVNVDITTRKEAEEQLRETSRRIRALAGQLISAQEDERRRLSRELHDDLSQKIAALSVAISKLKRTPPATSEQFDAEMTHLYRQTNELTSHVRELSHDLHPPALEHLGLKLALEIYVIQFQRQEEIEVEYAARLQSEKLPFDISVCVYRIAVEGLRNIAKHSRTKSASVLLEEDEQTLTLKIADTGVGFDLNKARTGDGIGLVSAEERIRLLQGTFEIQSSFNGGTTLTARIPIRGDE